MPSGSRAGCSVSSPRQVALHVEGRLGLLWGLYGHVAELLLNPLRCFVLGALQTVRDQADAVATHVGRHIAEEHAFALILGRELVRRDGQTALAAAVYRASVKYSYRLYGDCSSEIGPDECP